MKDLYQQMTDTILAEVDEAGEWKPCWRGMANGLPINAVTSKKYRGINILSCWVSAMRRGYEQSQWASFKQWQEKGATVRKGEKGTPILFYKVIEGETAKDDKVVVRGSYVFNVAQVDNAPMAEAEPATPLDPQLRIARIENWLAMRRWSWTLTHDAGDPRAYYRPSTDSVNMPDFTLFDDAEHYYSVLFHELTHWTGAKHRLDRDFSRHEREAIAREELVAELGAAFLCAEHGIAQTTRTDHVSYIASWLDALKNDKRAIVSAASQASAAVDFLEALEMMERKAA